MDTSEKWTLKSNMGPCPSGTYIYEKPPTSSNNLIFGSSNRRHPVSSGLSFDELGRRSQISRLKFEVLLDAENYRPDEITVETINDMLIVQGKQKECSINEAPRHFERYFRFDRLFRLEDIFSVILEDGILKIQTIPATVEKMRHLDELEAADTAIE